MSRQYQRLLTASPFGKTGKVAKKCILLLLTVVCATFVSCSDDNYLNCVPQMSQLVISINSAKVSGTQSPIILRSLLHVSQLDESGLDLSSNVYFFEDAQSNLGLCAKVDDNDKLADVLKKANLEITKKRGYKFAVLPSNWVIGFSDKAALLMGPALPAAQNDLMVQMARYLGSEEDDGLKASPMYDKLDSIDAPMAMVCQANALPQQFVAPFTIGAPKDADPSDIMVEAGLEMKGGRLLMNGHTFSFKKGINKALIDASKVYRPIKGSYVKSMSKNDVLGLFLNVDGKQFHQLITQNRGITAMLAGINAAIDMDNILKSVDGDMAIVTPTMGKDNLTLMMAAKLSGAPWLADVDYWKQSVPQGGHIGDWGKNCFYYQGDKTTYYFGVTPDMQYMSGGNKEQALNSIKSSSNPLPQDLQKMIVGQKLVMIINFEALKGSKAEALTALLKPMFGNVNTIVYTLK